MVGATLDGIVQAVAAAVLVVVLGFGHCIIDVDGGDFQLAFFQHVQQTVHTGGCFFRDAVNLVQLLRVSLVHQAGQVAAVIENHVGVPDLTVFIDGLFDAPPELFFGLAFPGKHRNAGSGDGGRGVILGGENVARGPAYFRAQFHQGFDQHGGLDGHVNAAHDLGAGQRLFRFVFAAQCHQCGHFAFSDVDFATAPVGVFLELFGGFGGDFVVGEVGSNVHGVAPVKRWNSVWCECRFG